MKREIQESNLMYTPWAFQLRTRGKEYRPQGQFPVFHFKRCYRGTIPDLLVDNQICRPLHHSTKFSGECNGSRTRNLPRDRGIFFLPNSAPVQILQTKKGWLRFFSPEPAFYMTVLFCSGGCPALSLNDQSGSLAGFPFVS